MAILGAGGSVRLVGFAGRAAAGEPVDAPLPDVTPAQLAAKIREAMGRYDDRGSFRLVFTDTRDMNSRFTMNRGTPEEQKPILVSFRGRARHESDGTRWRTEYDSVMPSSGSTRLWPDRWSTGFDGTRRYDWQVTKNQFIVGECSFQARQWTPRSVIWEQGDPLAEMLEEAGRGKSAIAVTQRTIDGMRCYVVESKSPNGQWGGETVVSPRQGYLTIARTWTHRGRPYSTRRLQGFHEVAPGLWAPDRIEDETIDGPRRRRLAAQLATTDSGRGVSAGPDPAGGCPARRGPLRRRPDRPPVGPGVPQRPVVAGDRADAPGEVRLAAARFLAAHEPRQ